MTHNGRQEAHEASVFVCFVFFVVSQAFCYAARTVLPPDSP